MVALPPADYTIYGFSFVKTATAELASFVGSKLSTVYNDFLNGNTSFCGQFSSDFISLSIHPDSDSFDCQSIWVDAGEDVQFASCQGLGALVELEGVSSILGNFPCVNLIWQNMQGEILNEEGDTKLEVSEPGMYLFSFVHPNSSCTVTDMVEVLPHIAAFITNVGSDTVIAYSGQEVILEGNIIPEPIYSHSWTAISGTTMGIIIGATNYTVTASGLYVYSIRNDLTNCSSHDSVTVIFTEPFINEIHTTISDCDQNNGSATVELNPNVNYTSILWSNGETGLTIDNLPPGHYSVSVTSDNNQQEQTILIEEELSCKIVIEGHIYDDHFNQDCIGDNTTTGVECIMLHLMPDDIYTYSKPDGSYRFTAYPGDYAIEYIDEDQYELLCPSGGQFSVSMPDAGTVSNGQDFYIKREIGQNLKITAVNGSARPGFYHNNKIRCFNLNIEPTSALVTYVHDPVLEDVNLSNYADNYNPLTHTATWFVPSIPPNGFIDLQFNMEVPIGTPLGAELSETVKVEPIDVDIHPSDNVLRWTKIVVGSYDPNEKNSHTGENQWGGAITKNDTVLSYQILFQNTGTDTAFTVVVRDTLDENLDVESIRPSMASHDYILEFEGNNVLVFNFENILLPDSNRNEPGSHGYASFTIKRNKFLLPEKEIKNRAAIYFDYNDPIITNETVHYIPFPVSIVSESIYICEGEMYNGEIYTENTLLKDTLHYQDIDSIFLTYINVFPAYEEIIHAMICDEEIFEIDGNIFDAAGEYILQYTSTNGCDSSINVVVEKNESNLIEVDTIICEGDEFIFNEETLTDAGGYAAQLTNVNGCDSTVYLDLMVEFMEAIEKDTAVAIGSEIYGMSVFSDTIIVQTLTNENGCFYDLITNVSVFVGSFEINKNIDIQILPNPNNGQFILKGKIPESGTYSILIYNVYGQLVEKPFSNIYLNENFEKEIINETLVQGVYYLLLKGKEKKVLIKFAVMD